MTKFKPGPSKLLEIKKAKIGDICIFFTKEDSSFRCPVQSQLPHLGHILGQFT